MPSPIQFGWSIDKPPDYKVRLRRRDFRGRNPDSLMPGDALVRTVSEKLVGSRNQDPRFVVIPNAKAILGTRRRLETFQYNLMKSVADYMARYHPGMMRLTPETTLMKYPENEPTHPDNPAGYHLEVESWNPYDDYEEQSSHARGTFHWDWPHWPIISLCYGKFKNILDGTPRVTDIRQLARDHKMNLNDAIEMAEHDEGEHFQPKSSVLTYDNVEKYSIPIDISTEPIVLVNNTLNAGITHGRITSYRQDSTKSGVRPLHQVRVVLPREAQD